MQGFNLKHNSKIVTASMENGVTSIFLNRMNGVIHLSFCGFDSNTNQHVTWFESVVNERDIIKIKVEKVNQVAKIIKSESSMIESLEDKLVE